MAKNKIRNNRYKKNKEASQPVWGGLLMLLLKVFSGVAGIIFLSVLFVFLHDMVMQCNYFRAATVKIETGGMHHLTPAQIEKISHIKKGVNILSVNLQTARKRLLSNPWIEKAYIRRDYPSTITIRVKEHRPLAVIDFGQMFLIDTNGAVFKEVSRSDFPNLPLISGVDYLDWTGDNNSNGNSSQTRKAFRSVMEVLKLGKMKDAVLPDKMIDEIDVDKDIGLTLKTRSPVKMIKLGYGNYREKYRRMARILSYMSRNEQNPAFYLMDLSDPDRVVAKPEENVKTSTPEKKEA